MENENRITLCGHNECTGCMACKQKCSKNAISCKEINGFLYPYIDRDICVGCGICVSVCPVLNTRCIKGKTHDKDKECIAAWNKDDEVRMRSSSGGVFSAMAERIFEDGGIVFGAVWSADLKLEHQYIRDKAKLDRLRRSKYVQSDTKNTYNEVYRFLQEGYKIMYCGTPCQIAGLTSFLGHKDYENLVKVDVICQGVPSQKLFKKYINEIAASENCEVIDANFRSKENGWRCGLLLLLLQCRDKARTFIKEMLYGRNAYYNAFIKEYFMRDSCYGCKFKNCDFGYYSDVTIADFWRVGNVIPLDVENYEYGINAVIINTQRGKSFFESCADKLIVVERTWEEFASNGGLRRSHKRANNGEAYNYLQNHSWMDTQKKYFPLTMRERLKIFCYITIGEKRIRKIFRIIGRIK